MTLGLGRFEYYLIQLDELLLKASRTENAAKFLYENNGRTILFMLESLAKLYANLHNNKKFLKIKVHFKMLEDMLGSIDFYDGFAKDFLKDPEMPAALRIFLEEKKAEKCSALNKLLIKRKWINHDPLRTKKIRKKLLQCSWQRPEIELDLVKDFYLQSIKDINTFFAETGNEFTDLEQQVHELRRKLRWLSIYPQALQGAIQFKTADDIETGTVEKYLIPEIVHSPFNVMPAPGSNTVFLFLKKNYFLSLSWLIAELGKLKDNGLRIMITTEALQGTQVITDNIALHKAYELNKTTDDGLKNIMSRAYSTCSLYFKEKNLDHLIADISTHP